MKVAFLSIMDNGNWCRHMARGLRDYCGIDAVSYALQEDTYLNIPDDTVESLWKCYEGTLPDADFYITNDHTYFQLTDKFPKPTIIKCNGTFARKYGAWFEADRLRNGNLYITSNTDYTLARALGFSVQTIGPVYDHRLLPKPDFSTDRIWIGHAPTGPTKGTQDIAKHLQKYRRDGTVHIDFITNTPWKECIKRKSRCHIFIDQVNDWGAFGINAIESLALGSMVLNSPLHPYVRQHITHNPLFIFPEQLPTALSIPNQRTPTEYQVQEQAQHWAKQYFDISTQAPKLKDWITWLQNTK